MKTNLEKSLEGALDKVSERDEEQERRAFQKASQNRLMEKIKKEVETWDLSDVREPDVINYIYENFQEECEELDITPSKFEEIFIR